MIPNGEWWYPRNSWKVETTEFVDGLGVRRVRESIVKDGF